MRRFITARVALAHRLYIAAEKWAAPRCQRLISVCDAMTDHYVKAGIARPEQFVTIYSGMEVEPFLNPPRPRETVRAELGFRPEHVVITKVARLFHLKGHEFVIAAAQNVVRQHPNVRFLFVGDGNLRGRFQEQIARAGLEQAFVFAGLVPPSKVPELVHASDIIVHTSLWEGLARVLPQALIAGKPVVSYDVDGAREVVIPGETGYLLPPQSVEPLAAALSELAADPALARTAGPHGARAVHRAVPPRNDDPPHPRGLRGGAGKLIGPRVGHLVFSTSRVIKTGVFDRP